MTGYRASSQSSSSGQGTAGGGARMFFVAKWLFWVVMAVVLVADLATKEWAERNITREVALREVDPSLGNPVKLMTKPEVEVPGGEGEGMPFMPGVLHFKWAENYGAAFSIGSDSRGLLLILSIGILGIVFYYAYRTPVRMKFALVCLGLITGGAVGNIYDRIFFDTVDGRSHMYVDGAWTENPLYGHPTTAVRDFLYWPFDIPLYSTLWLDKDSAGNVIEAPRKWPIFNIADVAIVSGVIGVMVVIVFTPAPAGRRKEDEEEADGSGVDGATMATAAAVGVVGVGRMSQAESARKIDPDAGVSSDDVGDSGGDGGGGE